jgi:hypothetical protein
MTNAELIATLQSRPPAEEALVFCPSLGSRPIAKIEERGSSDGRYTVLVPEYYESPKLIGPPHRVMRTS